jgi:hypothetical protein
MSSSNRRRGRRFFGVSAIARDIVSTFQKMSTKPDQAQIREKMMNVLGRDLRVTLTHTLRGQEWM